MSKGTPIVTLRVSNELRNRINESIASANYYTKIEPYTLSSWILHAVKEKLDKIERGRKKGKNGAANETIVNGHGRTTCGTESNDSSEGNFGVASQDNETSS